MTEARTLRRSRRSTSSAETIPRPLRAWFAGEHDESGPPWDALIVPDCGLLGERWRAYRAEHPKAKPPAGWEWLDDPLSPRQPSAERIAEARAMMTKGRG